MLLSPQEQQGLRAWAETNQRLIPDRGAMNPSGTSYGVIKELGKLASRQQSTGAATVGGILGGWPGAALGWTAGQIGRGIGELGNRRAAREALTPADRRSLAQIIMEGARKGAQRSIPGAVAGQER
jgi:hypothetical protein